jgi:hypothetical protein
MARGPAFIGRKNRMSGQELSTNDVDKCNGGNATKSGNME